MKYKLTNEMLSVKNTVAEQLDTIRFELLAQKYNRKPTMFEFFTIDDETEETAKTIFREHFIKKYGLNITI